VGFTSPFYFGSRAHFSLGQERLEVFKWMSEVEYRSHHEDLSKNLLHGTGQWLLESSEYIEWGQSSVSSILWLHGMRMCCLQVKEMAVLT